MSTTTQLLALNTVPVKIITTRLGYRAAKYQGKAGELEKYLKLIEECIQDSQVRIFYQEQAVIIHGDQIKVDRYAFASQLVANRLRAAKTLYLMAASARPEDVDRIKEYRDQHALDRAVIWDAVLSEKVDYALDFIEKKLQIELRHRGQVLGKRLSCGYGDFQLQNQQWFHALLGLGQYGIAINEHNILNPEKTVTALIPVFDSRGDHE